MDPVDLTPYLEQGGVFLLALAIIFRVDAALRALTGRVDKLNDTLTRLLEAELRRRP